MTQDKWWGRLFQSVAPLYLKLRLRKFAFGLGSESRLRTCMNITYAIFHELCKRVNQIEGWGGALLNNLLMSNPRPVVQSYSSVSASGTGTQSLQSPPRNSSFRPRKLKYLTRFEREHFHTNNVTPDRPCSAFFNIANTDIPFKA